MSSSGRQYISHAVRLRRRLGILRHSSLLAVEAAATSVPIVTWSAPNFRVMSLMWSSIALMSPVPDRKRGIQQTPIVPPVSTMARITSSDLQR